MKGCKTRELLTFASVLCFLVISAPSTLFALNEPASLFKNSILTGLRDKDPSVRLRTLEMLENVHDEETILSLIETLRDPATYIQSEAMFLLQKIGNPAIPQLLEYTHSKDRSQRWRILHILSRNNVPEIIPILRKNIDDAKKNNDDTLLYTSLYSLGFIGQKDEITLLIENANGKSHQVALKALVTAAKRDLRLFFNGYYPNNKDTYYDTSIFNDVIKNLKLTFSDIQLLMNEKHSAYQAGALLTLQLLAPLSITTRQREYLKYKILTLIKSKQIFVQNLAIDLAGKFKMTQVLNFLIEELKDKKSEVSTQHVIIGAIANIAPDNAAAILLPFLNVSNLEESIIRALHKLGHKKLSMILLEKIINKNTAPHIKRISINILEKSNALRFPSDETHTLLTVLTQLISNIKTPPKLQLKALRLLGRLKLSENESKLRVYYLIELLKNKDTHSDVKSVSMNVLGKMALSKQEVQLLSKILIEKLRNSESDQNIPISSCIALLSHLAPPNIDKFIFTFLYRYTISVINALVKLKPPYLEDFLITFLSRPEISIKASVIRSLGAIKSKKSVIFLIQHLSSSNPLIVHETLKTLALIGDEKAVEPITLILLSSRRPLTIKNALMALGQLKNTSSIEYILPFLDHQDLSIRQSAVVTLKELEAKNILKQLLISYFSAANLKMNTTQKEYSELKQTIINTIATLSHRNRFNYLAALIKEEEDPKIKKYIELKLKKNIK